MEIVENIFADCDELVQAELELSAKANIPLSIEFTKEGGINITYIGSVNVQQGHLLIGNQFRDNTNLSHNISNNVQVDNISIENSQFAGEVAIGVGQITDQFTAQTLQPPKNPL